MQRVDLPKRMLRRYLAIPKALRSSPVYLAVSGGMDSSVLASVALKIRAELPPLNFVHVNYHLRVPDSDREEAFLRDWAHREEISIHVLSLHPKGKPPSLQAWARERRLAFFRDIAGVKAKCPGIVWMAHHREDQAETVLARLLRGAGWRGLGGMQELENLEGLWVFRPFLDVPQNALRIFAKAHRLAHLHDYSNDSDDYLRNRIRHHILPMMAKENPQIVEVLKEFAVRAGEVAELQEALAQRWLRQSDQTTKGPPKSLSVKGLRRKAPALRGAILESWIRQVTGSPQSYGNLLPILLEALKARVGRLDIPLKGGFRLSLDQNFFYIRRSKRQFRG